MTPPPPGEERSWTSGRWNRETVRSLQRTLRKLVPEFYDLRHEIHRFPDLSGHEEPTAERVLAALQLTGVPDTHGGRVFRVGDENVPAIALRAELDALPIQEDSPLEFRSLGAAMHACGHDIHLAALTAVAAAIERTGPILPLVGILQPREEAVPSGAVDMLDTPQLRAGNIAAVIGAHVQPRLPRGSFSALPGAVNASADDFELTISAHGGHAGYPHTTGDPIVAAAGIITQLQAVVARQLDPTHTSVITVGSIVGGSAPNVIPNSVVMTGTIRASDAGDRELLSSQLVAVSTAISALNGCQAEIELFQGEPVLMNDPGLAGLTTRWILDSSCIVESEPLRSCGADDFAYYGSRFPSLMIFVGVGTDGGPGLHHPSFAPSDDTIDLVAEVLLAGYLAGCESVLGPLGE